MDKLSDHEAELIRGGARELLDAEAWGRQLAQAQKDWQSFWSLFQILAQSAWVSMTSR